jgi:hypothetical protein
MNVADFNVGKTYLIKQQGVPAAGSSPALAPEVMVIEVLQSVGMASATVYQAGRFVKADTNQLRAHHQYLRAVKRSSRRVFLIHPETIVSAVLLKD